MLYWFVLQDPEETLKARVLNLATGAGLRIFPRSKKAARDYASLRSGGKITVELEVLHQLAVLGLPSDFGLLRPLLSDPNVSVRSRAEITQTSIKLRINPEKTVLDGIRSGQLLDQEIAERSARHIGQISKKTLIEAVEKVPSWFGEASARELLHRKEISLPLAKTMVRSSARSVRACGYLGLVALGETVDRRAVRADITSTASILNPNVQSWDRGDPEEVIQAALTILRPSELWQIVDSFEADSSLAVRVLSTLDSAQSELRTRFDEGFRSEAEKARADTANSIYSPFSLLWLTPESGIESLRRNCVLEALRGFANIPHVNDRQRFINILSSTENDPELTYLSLQGVARLGHKEDRAKIEPSLHHHLPRVEASAALAWLALSPDFQEGVSTLLKKVTRYRLWAVVLIAMKRPKTSARPLIEPLLRNDDEQIRRLACYLACRILERRQLEKLLKVYITPQHYYYNVVCILDRMLYAPPKVRKYYQVLEDNFFESFRSPADDWWRA